MSRATQHTLRDQDRRPVELRGYVVRSTDEIVDVRILNLSFNGCGIETHTQLEAGEQLKLSVLGRGAIRATVRWYAARRAGLLFLADPPAQKHWPRRADRRALVAEALIRRAGKAPYRTQAVDFSPLGCKCEFIDRPEINERVWIKFSGLESLEATTAWVEGATAGFRFSRPIHSAVYDMLCDRLG
jgi:hypothetical protein